ncbi:TetR/AcrR family transcriptional regulator [Candidatus Binatia bacterium]|jgi:AcrR family transcriptional regulator|nr:TetR/AcrR family transcriptional regulator [Candidatus Binatia bacterium]
MLPPRVPVAANRDRKGDRTRERLFQAAIAEFRESGFEAASVGAIAQRAGTSRASFYFYYPSKEAVLLDLQWRVEMEVVDQTRHRAGLRAFLDALIDAICSADSGIAAGGLLRVTLAVYIRQPAGLDLSDQPFPLMMEVARRFIEARDDELRPGLDPAQATELFLASLFGLIAGTAGPVATRRDALHTLATLFLADETPVER